MSLFIEDILVTPVTGEMAIQRSWYLDVHVTHDQSKLAYRFTTENGDIKFSVTCKDSEGHDIILKPEVRVPSHIGVVAGTIQAPNLETCGGIVTFRWNNSYSWFTSKTLRYQIDAVDGNDDVELLTAVMRQRSNSLGRNGCKRRSRKDDILGILQAQLDGKSRLIASLKREHEASMACKQEHFVDAQNALEAEIKVMRIALEERGHSQCSELKTMIADLEHRIGTIEKEKSTLHTELRMVREEKIRLHGVCEDMTMQLRVAIEDASNSKEKAEEIMEANDELSRVLTAKSERNDVLESEVEALQKICEDLEKAEQGAFAEAHKDIKESKETFECGNKHLFAENIKLQKELHAMELIVDTLNRQTRAKDKDLEILNMEKLELTESLNDSSKMWSIRKQEYMKKVDILEQEKEYLLERVQTVEIENEKLAISLRDMENMKFRNVEPLRSTASADRANATEEADAPAVKRLKGQLADSEIALMNTQTQLVQAEDKIESQFSQISELNAQSELASRQQSLLQDEFDHVKCALENSRSEFVQIEEENQVLIKELAKWSQSMQSSMKISAGIEGKSTHNGVGSTLPGGPSSDQSASQRVSDEEMALPKNQLVNISVAPLISPLRHTSSFTSDDSTPRSERSGRSSRTSRSYRKLASGEQTPDGSMKRKSSRRLAKKSSDSSFGVFSSLILGVDSVSNKVYSPTSPCTPRTPGDEKS